MRLTLKHFSDKHKDIYDAEVAGKLKMADFMRKYFDNSQGIADMHYKQKSPPIGWFHIWSIYASKTYTLLACRPMLIILN